MEPKREDVDRLQELWDQIGPDILAAQAGCSFPEEEPLDAEMTADQVREVVVDQFAALSSGWSHEKSEYWAAVAEAAFPDGVIYCY